MIVKCFAKVNLYLNISHKRPDGFHEIQSLFQTISLFDTLRVSSGESFNLSISPTSSAFAHSYALTKGNILEKVYNFFKNEYSIPPVHVELEKRIPMGAGLGGGSSDAAGFIQVLNKLNRLNLDTKELKRIGTLFGSDVPFFIHGGCCKVTGRGEKIEPLESLEPVIEKPLKVTDKVANGSLEQPLERHKKMCKMPILSVILIYPEVHISTQEAYGNNIIKNREVDFEQIIHAYKDYPLSDNEVEIKKYVDKVSDFSYNSFEGKTLIRYPKIFEAYKDLKKYSNYVLLSGSGSCVFAVFPNECDLTDTIEKLAIKYKYTYHVQTNDKGILFT